MSFTPRILFIGLCVAAFAFGGEKTIPAGKKIYIERMEGNLQGYIQAEFTKQRIPLTIVIDAESADLIMTGSVEQKDRKWHEGWLTKEQDHAAGNISIIDKAAKTILWSGEAGDRSLMWGALARGGQRKVAARIVDKLKDAIAE